MNINQHKLAKELAKQYNDMVEQLKQANVEQARKCAERIVILSAVTDSHTNAYSISATKILKVLE